MNNFFIGHEVEDIVDGITLGQVHVHEIKSHTKRSDDKVVFPKVLFRLV